MIEVIVKVQRPFLSSSNWNEVLSYIVDEDDNQLSNPAVTTMKLKEIKKLFGDNFKVYYFANYEHGKPVVLTRPTREDEWV